MAAANFENGGYSLAVPSVVIVVCTVVSVVVVSGIMLEFVVHFPAISEHFWLVLDTVW